MVVDRVWVTDGSPGSGSAAAAPAPTPPAPTGTAKTDYSEDFASGLPAEWRVGSHVTTGLPTGSKGAVGNGVEDGRYLISTNFVRRPSPALES